QTRSQETRVQLVERIVTLLAHENDTSARYVVDLFFFIITRRPPTSTLIPTRRSSDLSRLPRQELRSPRTAPIVTERNVQSTKRQDRKSTRLNSSHVATSYAVFCLKKKKPDLHHSQRSNNSRSLPRLR